MKTNNLELWEIMKDGSHGEVFEVTNCVLSQFMGHQIKVHEKEDMGASYRCLVNPNSEGKGDSDEVLSKLYGCLGTAKFKKVEQYEEISFTEALNTMNNFRKVYVIKEGEKVEITRYTDFSDLYLTDFADLMNKTYYKKG